MANDLKLKLSIDGAQVVDSTLNRTAQNVEQLGQAGRDASIQIAELRSQFMALTGVMAGVATVQKAMMAASDYSSLTARMALLTGSAQKAGEAMQSVYDIAQRQGANLMAVGDSYAKIGQAMTALGGTAVDTGRMVETVSAALRLGNASTQEAASAMRQFGQAMAKGKLNGDEFVSLMENAPYLMDAVAASLGKTKGDLFSMSEAGQLTARVMSDAVLSSFDTVTAKAATLPRTMGQAAEGLTNAFTKAAADSKMVALVSSGAMWSMSEATEHAGMIVDTLAKGAMVMLARQGMLAASAIYAQTTATAAATAANVQHLQSTFASADAKAIYTGMVLREAQATLASTTGLGASVVAQNAVVAATTAHTAATLAQTEAQVALNAATSIGSRALGLLGGPIGAITTVLGLGLTAWTLWGDSAKESEEKSTKATEQSTKQIIADLDNQIERIERRNALAGMKTPVAGLDKNSAAADRLGALQIELNALDGSRVEADLVRKNLLLREQGELLQKIIQVERSRGVENARLQQEAYTAAWAKYAPVVDDATAAITAEKKALGDAFSPAMEARIRAFFAAKSHALSDATKGINLYNDLLSESSGYSADYAEKVALLKAAFGAHRISVDELDKAMAVLNSKQPGAIALEKQRLEIAKLNTKAVDDYFDAQEKLRLANEAQIKTARTTLDQIEFETKLLGLNSEQRALATMERDLERQVIVKGTQAYDAYIERLRVAVSLRSDKQAEVDAAKKSSDEWKKGLDETLRLGRDVFNTLGNDGVNMAQKVGDALGTAVKSALFDLTAKPIMVQVYTSIAGGDPMGKGGAALGGLGAKFADWFAGTTVGRNTLLSATSGGGLAGATPGELAYANAIAQGTDATTAAAAATKANTTAMKSMATTLSQYAAIAVGMTEYSKAIAGGRELGGVTGEQSMWAGASILGPMGATFAPLMVGLFGKGQTNLNEQGVRGTLGTQGSNVGGYYITQQDRGLFGGDGLEGTGKDGGYTYDRALTGYMDAVIAQTSKSVKGYADALGLNASAVDGYTKAIDVSTKDLSPEDAQKKIKEALGAFGEDLAKTVIGSTSAYKDTGVGPAAPSYARAYETSQQALERLGTAILTVNDAFDNLDASLKLVGLQGASVASDLIDAFGGLQNFTQQTSSYYSNFYRKSEQEANTRRQLTSQLGNLGIALPGSRDAYRAEVDKAAKNLGTAEGDAAYATLIKLSDAFASIVPAAEAATDSMKKIMDQLDSDRTSLDAQLRTAKGLGVDTSSYSPEALAKFNTNEGIKKEIADLNQLNALKADSSTLAISLLRAEGHEEQALAAERKAAIAGMSALTIKQYDANEATKKAIQLLTTNAALQDRLDIATGAKTQQQIARAHELVAATDQSSIDLLNQIYAAEDRSAAAAAAAAARDKKKSEADAAAAAKKAAIDSAKQALDNAYKTEVDKINSVKSAFEDLGKSLTTFRDHVQDTLAGLAGPQTTYDRTKAAFTDVSNRAALGDKTAMESLSTVGNDFMAASLAASKTAIEYQRDLMTISGSAGTAISVADRQVNIAQLQLDALNKLVDGLITKEKVPTVQEAIDALNAAQSMPGKVSGKGSGNGSGKQRGADSVIAPMLQSIPIAPMPPMPKMPSAGASSEARTNAELLAEIRLLRQEQKAANFTIALHTQRISKLNDKWDIDGQPAVRAA